METRVKQFQCPNCGAAMEWSPEAGKLRCVKCQGERIVPAEGTISEIPFEHYAGQERVISESAVQVTCSGCGATTPFEPTEVAGRCPFCAAPIVAQPKAADPLIAPHGVLPFRVTKERAQQAVKAWLAGLWFAPNDLTALARPDGVQGVYLPYWTFDAQSEARYYGHRGEWRQDNRGNRQLVWWECSGGVGCDFDDVLLPATKAVQPRRLDNLEPWDNSGLRPYDQAYLAGFKAQRYQTGLEDAFRLAVEHKMTPFLRQLAERDIGGDAQRVEQLSPRFGSITFKHVLLPVWIGAYRYQGNVYQVVVNAQNGEVSGERPHSAIKIAIAVALFALIVWFVFVRE